MQYLSTFISGTNELVVRALKSKINDVKIDLILDGLVVYQTKANLFQVRELRFFNNSFIIINQLKLNSRFPLQVLISNSLKSREIEKLKKIKFNGRDFKIFVFNENQPFKVDREVLVKVENKIKQLTHLRLNINSPQNEFWFLYRREKIGFFLYRITKNKKKLKKGELRPEISNLLVFLASPKKTDVILDPFAGNRSIPSEVKKSFPHKKVYSFDITDYGLEKGDFSGLSDIREIPLDENSVDVIVTDPPWGDYRKISEGKGNFYSLVFEKFNFVLKSGGKIVLLISRDIKIDKFLKEFNLKVIEKYDVLVSGKKASMVKLIKNGV